MMSSVFYKDMIFIIDVAKDSCESSVSDDIFLKIYEIRVENSIEYMCLMTVMFFMFSTFS